MITEVEIEEEGLKILALHQPVTVDLRFIVAVIKINLLLISRHLERLADHATDIAEEVIYLIEGDIVRHGLEIT
ncbi:MAG: hypothetical protein HKM93_07815 [Desulfobacteraceae bacterium]|nr:hypothetical protein [Desulfobacteraceae bacterium]